MTDEPFGVKDGSFTETSVFTKVDGVEPPIQDTGKTLQEEKSMHYFSLSLKVDKLMVYVEKNLTKM